MRDFYQDPSEQKKWGELCVSEGLYPTEAHLVTKYFRPGAEVLNVGCGGGREAIALAGAGFQVTAVDNQPPFVKQCRISAEKHSVQIRAVLADATQLPFPDGQFDHVAMVGQLLGHVRGRENRIKALKEIRRVIKPGCAIVSTNAVERSLLYRAYFLFVNLARKVYNPRQLEPYDAYVRRIGGKHASRRKTRPVFHWYHQREFEQDAAEAGWDVVECLRRYEFEQQKEQSTTSGETFYALRKVSA